MTKSLAALAFAASVVIAAPPPPTPAKPKPAAPPASAEFTKLSKAADAAREANNLDEALRLYAGALRLRPKWPEGWWYAGTILYDKDRYKEARDAFRNVVALTPKMAPALGLLGLCEYQTKEYEPALAHLEQARALGLNATDPLGAPVIYHLSLLLSHGKMFERALDVLTRSGADQDSDPKFIAAAGIAGLHKPLLPNQVPAEDRELVFLAGKAVLHTRARRVTEAQKDFEELITKYPKTPYVHFLYGSFLMVSEPDKGMTEIRKELEILPRNVSALIQMADELLKRGEAQSALEYAAKAVDIEPETFVTHGFYGRCLMENGDVSKAISELEIAERLAPDSPQIRIFLASAYAKAGRKEDAARERKEFQRLQALVAAPTVEN